MARKLTDLYGALLQAGLETAGSERGGDQHGALPAAAVLCAAVREDVRPRGARHGRDRGHRAAVPGADEAAARRRLRRRARRPCRRILFAAAIVGIFLLRGILSFSSSYFLAWVATAWCSTCARRCSRAWCACRRSFFDDHSSGAVLSKVAYDVGGVTAAATTVLTVVVQDSIAVIGLLGLAALPQLEADADRARGRAADRAVRAPAVQAPAQHGARGAARDGRPGARARGNHRVPQGGQDLRRPGLRDRGASSAPTSGCAASTCARRCPRRSARR